MAATRAQKIRLGAFTLAAAAALLVVLVVFAGLRFWEKHETYVIYYEGTVRGLEEGAVVTFGGIRVGTVDKLEVAPDDLRRIKVTIRVKSDTPVRTDTTAMLEFAGITGLKVIDLRGGDVAAARLPPGGTIAAGETILDKFEKQAAQLAERSELLMGSAQRVLDNLAAATDPEKLAALDQIVANARAATEDLAGTSAALRGMIGENREGLRRTVASIDQAAARVSLLLDQEVPRLVGQAEGILANAGGVIAGANGVVGDLQDVVRGNEAQLRSALFDLRQASRSFKELARDLRAQPSRLFLSQPARDRKLP